MLNRLIGIAQRSPRLLVPRQAQQPGVSAASQLRSLLLRTPQAPGMRKEALKAGAFGRSFLATLTAATGTALLSAMVGDSGSGGTKGLVPAPAAGDAAAAKFLKADGTFAVPAGSGSGSPSIPQGRLSLVTATPVMTTTQSAKTTIYYTPYTGQYCPLYDGSAFAMTDLGGELSQTTTDTTKSPAAVANNSNYDLFVWSDSGTYRCTRGPAWTSDTGRGTGAGTSELVKTKGIWLNTVSITNGPAASRGTYVGTVRSNGSAQIDWIYGAIATNGTAGFFGVWNAYNRVAVYSMTGDDTNTWNLAAGNTRAANNSTTMRVSFVSGLAEDRFYASYAAPSLTAVAGGSTGNGVGVDSTTVMSGRKSFNSSTVSLMSAGDHGAAFLGFHYFQAMEWTLTQQGTFAGDGGAATIIQNGLDFQGMM